MQRFLFLSLKSLSHNCCWGVLEFMKDEKSFSKAFSSCIFPHQHSTYQAKSFSKYIIHKKLYFFLKQKRRKINKKGFVWSSHFHNFLFLVKFYVACVFLFVFIYWIFDVKRTKLLLILIITNEKRIKVIPNSNNTCCKSIGMLLL